MTPTPHEGLFAFRTASGARLDFAFAKDIRAPRSKSSVTSVPSLSITRPSRCSAGGRGTGSRLAVSGQTPTTSTLEHSSPTAEFGFAPPSYLHAVPRRHSLTMTLIQPPPRASDVLT